MKFLTYGSVLIAFSLSLTDATANCMGNVQTNLGGVGKVLKIEGGGFAAYAKMNINIDGSGRAYHPDNAKAGALIHLCNAGKVFLPDGSSYQGSESNETCVGKFMADVARIGKAGWKDPKVGAVNWFGILGQESATISGKKVENVIPVSLKDGSGFYVSPTSLVDTKISDQAEQARYVDPLRVAAAVVPKSILAQGVELGSFGVAFDSKKKIAVPFVVGDSGPRIGEGSVALVRAVAGLPYKENISREERFAGQVEDKRVLWVFFGDGPKPYDSKDTHATKSAALAAYEAWGGQKKLEACVSSTPKN